MSKKFLLLHQRFTVDDQDIWREAVRNGYKTERVGMIEADIKRRIPNDVDEIAYYGNVLQSPLIEQYTNIRFKKINLWNLMASDLTGRRIYLLLGWMLKESFKDCFGFDKIGGHPKSKLFLKSAGPKWIESKPYNFFEFKEIIEHIKDEDFFYLQSIINISAEIRTFVKNGKILTSSYYRNYDKTYELSSVEPVILEKLQSLTDKLWKDFDWPDGVVFDFAFNNDTKDWIFLEPNEAYASGLYNCNPKDCFEVIKASQTYER